MKHNQDLNLYANIFSQIQWEKGADYENPVTWILTNITIQTPKVKVNTCVHYLQLLSGS